MNSGPLTRQALQLLQPQAAEQSAEDLLRPRLACRVGPPPRFPETSFSELTVGVGMCNVIFSKCLEYAHFEERLLSPSAKKSFSVLFFSGLHGRSWKNRARSHEPPPNACFEPSP